MEILLSVIGGIASLFAMYKIFSEILLSKYSNKREEYVFGKELIKDLLAGEEHTYALEKGFLALTGRMYSKPEIELLLSQDSPSLAINNRNLSSKFVEFDHLTLQYKWKPPYGRKIIQKFGSMWFFVWYVIAGSLCLAPIFSKGIAALLDYSIVLFSLSLLIFAVICLNAHIRFNRAKIFMRDLRYKNIQEQEQISR